MISNPDDYFVKGCGRCARFETPECSTQIWTEGLSQLRRICREVGLTETVKWGHPCYMHSDRNIAVFGAFRGDFRLSFMNPGLLDDHEKLLEKAGPNSQVAGVMRFSNATEVREREPILRDYLAQLITHAEAGTKPPKTKTDIELPSELIEALDSDPELSEAFHELTPGRQRSYVINLNNAKQTETRVRRIAAFRNKILAGKGAMER